MTRRERLNGSNHDDDKNLSSKDVLNGQQNPEYREAPREYKKSRVDALDDVSSLLIDISTNVSKKSVPVTVAEFDNTTPFKLLEELKFSELIQIDKALSGWQGDNNIYAPCYKPSQEVINAIYKYIHSNKRLSSQLIDLITLDRAKCSNFQSFIISGHVKNAYSEGFKLETEDFLHELKEGIEILNCIFDKVGLKRGEKRVFHRFISRTATLLFNLGFADAINHSSQVARKGIIDSFRNNETPVEILQHAIIGWIHDPKLPGNFSWSNLSTHPIVASAIALEVLTQPDLQNDIQKYLASLKPEQKAIRTVEDFIKGIVEAVAINNDSKFVLDYAIFERPVWAPGLPESGGVLDQIDSMSKEELNELGIESFELKEVIIKTALERFYAPSNMTTATSFDYKFIKLLKKVKIETGLIGIKMDSYRMSCSRMTESKHLQLCQKTPVYILNKILLGTLEDQNFIKNMSIDLKQTHKNERNTFVNVVVPGDKLFSHQDEMKYAPKAATNLGVADRLLLSPHKILEAGVQDSVIGRIVSFIDSFSDNITTLPKVTQLGGSIFQRDLYVSILRAADELTGNNNYAKFKTLLIGIQPKYLPFMSASSSDIDERFIMNQIIHLERIIKSEEAWINKKAKLNLAHIDPDDPRNKEIFKKILCTIKEHYDVAIERSPEMFGYVKVTNLNMFDKFVAKL